jgi:serine/alanine adding enzyme
MPPTLSSSLPGAARAIVVHRYEGPGSTWDAFVADTPGSSHCHLWGWREVITRTFGHECLYLVAADSAGTWQGVLPLARVRSRVFGHYLVSMPFLNRGGPIGTPEAQRALVDEAVGEAQRSGAHLLELRARDPLPGDLHVSSRKLTVTLDLPATPEPLLKGFHQKVRANTRKAGKAGAEMRYGPEQMEAFYDVYAESMRDLGTPVLPQRFFAEVRDQLAGVVTFGALWLEGRPIAGQCAFEWQDGIELVWGSARREHHALKASSAIHWAFMERAVRHGRRLFDFGRSTPGSGPHEFKKSWGGVDVPLPWAQWSPNGVVATPSADKPLFRAATATWMRLPLGVANRVGPFLSPWLP